MPWGALWRDIPEMEALKGTAGVLMVEGFLPIQLTWPYWPCLFGSMALCIVYLKRFPKETRGRRDGTVAILVFTLLAAVFIFTADIDGIGLLFEMPLGFAAEIWKGIIGLFGG